MPVAALKWCNLGSFWCAEMVHQRGGSTCAVEDVEQVLTLTDQGLSQRKIADATGIGSSTVGRMQKTAAELDEPVPVA